MLAPYTRGYNPVNLIDANHCWSDLQATGSGEHADQTTWSAQLLASAFLSNLQTHLWVRCLLAHSQVASPKSFRQPEAFIFTRTLDLVVDMPCLLFDGALFEFCVAGQKVPVCAAFLCSVRDPRAATIARPVQPDFTTAHPLHCTTHRSTR